MKSFAALDFYEPPYIQNHQTAGSCVSPVLLNDYNPDMCDVIEPIKPEMDMHGHFLHENLEIIAMHSDKSKTVLKELNTWKLLEKLAATDALYIESLRSNKINENDRVRRPKWLIPA